MEEKELLALRERRVPTPKWLVVARNEYRIHTSRIRSTRPYFPYLVVGLLAVYVTFIAPAVVSLFIDDFLAFILSQAAVAMVQIILFMIFINFIIVPIVYTLQEGQTGQLEIFLARARMWSTNKASNHKRTIN